MCREVLPRTLPRRQSDGSWPRGHLTSNRVRARFGGQLAVSGSGPRLYASRSGPRARSGISPPVANVAPRLPGELLLESLAELEITRYRFARTIGVPARRINEIGGRR